MALPKGALFRNNDGMAYGLGGHDGIDRYFHGNRQPQNPYLADYSNYYAATFPAQQYGILNNGYGLKYGSGVYPAEEFHHSDISQSVTHRPKSKNSSLNALTLLAFLFFINVLQNCLKEQMVSLNPTVMVMTAGASRIQKNHAGVEMNSDFSKESDTKHNNDDHEKSTEIDGIPDRLTNDHGDSFYRPTYMISSKLSSAFEDEFFNETIKT